tara:strand:+ start:2751 stop:3278 length:528 start_codon:yes stop_codon:yes gene_type:complete
MIIGLTGKNASGKGEVAEFLKSNGFEYHSLSDVLREEATKLNIEHTRDNLINLGNELRSKHGSNYLAKKTLEKVKDKAVIDSIRNPEEINELKTNKDFKLLAIDAPIELRFERMKSRSRLGDATTIEKLKEQEQRENTETKSSQQLDKCIELADQLIINDGSLEELHNKIKDIIQ